MPRRYQITRPPFDRWKELVDEEIAARLLGLTSNDLPDLNYRDLYQSGATPDQAASRAIRNARGESD